MVSNSVSSRNCDSPVRKASSINSMFINTTINKPSIDTMISAVATILHSQMLEDLGTGKEIPEDSELYYFSEQKYIKEKPEDFDQDRILLLRQTPSVEEMMDFIKALFDTAQFSPECCIICLVYINRLISFTEMPLQPTNWRPLVLCSLLVAQKIWDDNFIQNIDFAFMYPFFLTN